MQLGGAFFEEICKVRLRFTHQHIADMILLCVDGEGGLNNECDNRF